MERCARGSPGMLSAPGIFLAKPLPWIICKKVIIWIKYKRTEFTGALTNKNNLLHFWKHLRLVVSLHLEHLELMGLMVIAGEPIDKNHNQKNNSFFFFRTKFSTFSWSTYTDWKVFGVNLEFEEKMMILMELLFLKN